MDKLKVSRNIFRLACLLNFIFSVSCISIKILNDRESERINFLVDLVSSNLKTNGWRNIIIFGHFPNDFYVNLKIKIEQHNHFTFVVSNTNDDDYYVEDTVPYHSNSIILNCHDFANFEESLLNVLSLVYWHPHANVYLYYHAKESEEHIARIYFIFWYYRAINVILIEYNDTQEVYLISQYTPFVSDVYNLEKKYGCWTVKKIGMPIYTFDESFMCENDCQNVSISSKLRATNLGTCIGIITNEIKYNDTNIIHNMTLFDDKGRNFHGFHFRSFTTEVLPFTKVQKHANETYSLASRDGNIWNTISKILNFTIDLTASKDAIKKPFDFEINIQQIFAVAHRKGDLFLAPIYQFDVIVVEIDYTFPFKDSGVCFVSHRAGFETVLLDFTTLIQNYDILLKFGLSFVCIWILFCVFTKNYCKTLDMDFMGKNLLNTVRSVLLINLYGQPKNLSFRVFLAIIIWSFFIINFVAQAAIISFFTAFKRGHEVDTFEDIIDKGYRIEGMASPDVVLPDTEERFRKINSKLSPIRELFACVKALNNDSHRFCLLDCSVGRYLERNMLNDKGEQYLHIAKDRIHSHYLNFIFSKHSVFTDNFNKYMMFFFEAGLIKKWEEYKYSNIKEEAPNKPLSMNDVQGVFNLYGMLVVATVFVFLVEIIIGYYKYFHVFTRVLSKIRRKAKKIN